LLSREAHAKPVPHVVVVTSPQTPSVPTRHLEAWHVRHLLRQGPFRGEGIYSKTTDSPNQYSGHFSPVGGAPEPGGGLPAVRAENGLGLDTGGDRSRAAKTTPAAVSIDAGLQASTASVRSQLKDLLSLELDDDATKVCSDRSVATQESVPADPMTASCFNCESIWSASWCNLMPSNCARTLALLMIS